VRLAIIITAALAAVSCRPPNDGAVRVDPALATLVPADTTVLVGSRLDKLRDTALYRERFDKLPMPQLDKFAADTGLDPRRDVWELLFCSNGKDKGVLMVRGKFAPAELEPKLEREGAARTKYKSYSLFGDERTTMFFMNSSTALAGSTPVIKSVIDSHDSGGGGIPPLLVPLMKEIPRNAQFWAAFSGVVVDMPFREDSNLGNINTMIRSLENGYVAADLSQGLDLKAVGKCRTDEGAKQIHDALRGVIGIGRLSTPDNRPDLLKAFDGVKVEQQARAVIVTAQISQDLVDRVLDLFTSSRPGSRPRGSLSPRLH
jgi:hypothetical protein